MALASLSKAITGAAVLRALESNTGEWDPTPTLHGSIAPYFPSWWNRNSYFSMLTFENCLQYATGISTEGGHDWSLASTMSWVTTGSYTKDGKVYKIEQENIGKFQYNNASFAWFRIAIFYLTAKKEMRDNMDLLYVLNSKLWHLAVSSYYRDYIKWTVFPQGLQGDVNPHFGKWTAENETLYYHYPNYSWYPGWAMPSSLLDAGGEGWVVSAYDLAWFFAELIYGKILTDPMRAKLFNYPEPATGKSYVFGYGQTTLDGYSTYDFFSKGGALQGIATEFYHLPLNGVQVTLLSNYDLKNNYDYPLFPGSGLIKTSILEAYIKSWYWGIMPATP